MTDKPLVISCPLPRTLPLIFAPDRLAELHARYEVIETTDEDLPGLPDAVLSRARHIIGQPPLDTATLARLSALRCVFNVESNLLNNMPYDEVFARGIHVVTTGAVFALPVAEMGLGMALSLLRGIHSADADFRAGTERWGGDGNAGMRQLSGATVGIVGFGDLGRALGRVLTGFRPRLLVHDPWQAPSVTRAGGAEPVGLDALLAQSDVVFVTAAVTSENAGFLGAEAFASMKPGAAFILLSRAEVVDFEALMAAVDRGHIRAATDVFPQEPMPADHPVRGLEGLLLSAHRAGALDSAFAQMGEMVLEDMDLIDRGLPPQVCKRAERETVARMRSRPVSVN
ncbi:hydroxyacid dehydrogenase [Flavimaricola marinus]|uniref:D-3-phosphoglycerate dehydrogenase n=1 Tax=Flavimaricola marinus TaxID=1819565 RepID=A0A238LI51_9RHOB|nr:hydroxyacid dehydrogenase [Flavimaricola marinus]SMY08636.1 D-3-phosphoglycerate dehydrogenase [Flavimaricola marinus]